MNQNARSAETVNRAATIWFLVKTEKNCPTAKHASPNRKKPIYPEMIVVVSGSANRYIGRRSINVPIVMSSKIVPAPMNFPSTVCQFFRGKVSNSSIVRELYSPEKSRIEITGQTIVNMIPML